MRDIREETTAGSAEAFTRERFPFGSKSRKKRTLRRKPWLESALIYPAVFVSEVISEADEGKGRWITVRGNHVYVYGDKILKGPKSLVGKALSDVNRPEAPKVVPEHVGVAGRGAWFIDGSGKEYDVTVDWGPGTNDHVGFLALAMSDDTSIKGGGIDPSVFGLDSKDVKKLKKFFADEGDQGDVIGKVFDSGAIRVSSFSGGPGGQQTLGVDSAVRSDRVVDRVLSLIEKHSLKPAKIYWETNKGKDYGWKEYTLEDFVNFKG